MISPYGQLQAWPFGPLKRMPLSPTVRVPTQNVDGGVDRGGPGNPRLPGGEAHYGDTAPVR